MHEAHERRRLSPGNDEPVQPLELIRLPNLHDLRAQAAQNGRVLAEISLEGKNSDSH